MTMLIEREKAIDAILSVDVHGDGQSQEALTHASVEVSLLPAVDAEPVKSGKWWHYEGMIICSECGAEFYDEIMEYCGDSVPKYCPDCGAKMDGEEE